LEYFPSGQGEISVDVVWGKNTKREKGKRGKYEGIRRKGQKIKGKFMLN
jgi:hypothetical protein